MNFYWYDHSATDGGQPHLNGLGQLVQLFAAQRIDSPDEFENKNIPKLGFIHAGTKSRKTDIDWEKRAKDGAWIVFVSSVGLGQQNIPEFVQNFKKPCDEVADYLTQEIANTFIESCNKGSPDFLLFYPRPMDNLVALYLLELASQDTGKIREIKELVRREAEREYTEIKGAGSELPQDAATLRIELRNILISSAAK